MSPNPVYCSMIHGGLNLNLKDLNPWIQPCCLRHDRTVIEIGKPFWPNLGFAGLQAKNNQGQWDSGCSNCQNLENSGNRSFRQGMNDGLGIEGMIGLSGPARIDIMFDISCNLACRTCGTHSSTFWQRHLKDFNEWPAPIFSPRKGKDVLATLGTLNLENLRQVVFCGGETLLGQEYWEVARWLVQNVPDAKQNLTLCFQTNGTQPISEKYHQVINDCKLVKLHVSIDAVGDQFEYLRWPAGWQQVTDNLYAIRDNLPSNVMFLIEQTISIFNVLYLSEVDEWSKQCFSANREGDPVDITRHLANGIYSLKNASKNLVQQLSNTNYQHLVPSDWKENSTVIETMLDQIKKFDQFRNQSFEQTFAKTFAAFREFW